MPVPALPTHSFTQTQPTDSIRTTALDRRAIDDLDRAIVTLSATINAATYDLLVLIREFDERLGWMKWGLTSCRHWLQWRCDLSASAAREKIRIAHCLKHLPAISNAFSTGRLSYSKVRALTRIASIDDEQALVQMAMKMSAAHVEQHCQQRRNAAPDSIRQGFKAQQCRSLRCWRDERKGTMTVTIELPIDEGELVEKAIDKTAASHSSDTQAPDEASSWSAMRADAVVAMARAALSGSSQLTTNERTHSSADHYLVTVHVDSESLTANQGASQLPIDTIKRLCCDAGIVPIVEGKNGEPLNVGRKQRTITTAIRRALWARDKGCAFPGCSHTRFVDAHHIIHWANNGETRPENLILLCSQHHKLVHEGGYRIKKDHLGKNTFKRPDGRVVPECGYQMDDWLDDHSANDPLAALDSVQDSVQGASAESGDVAADGVREVWGRYDITYTEETSFGELAPCAHKRH